MVVRGKHQWHIDYQMIKIVAVVCSPIFLVGMRLFAVQTNMTDWASVTIFQKSHDFDQGLFIIRTRPDQTRPDQTLLLVLCCPKRT